MNQRRDIEHLLTQARRAAPGDEALQRVWSRLQVPPPTDPDGGSELDLSDLPAPDAAAAASLGKALVVGAIKAVVAAAVVTGAVVAVSRGPATEPTSPGEPPREDPPIAAPAEPPAPTPQPASPEGPQQAEPEARPAPPRTTPRPPRREPPPASPDADLAAERALIASAQAAHQRKDLSAARAHLDEHARRFPRGLLADERELLRVLTLCDAGETAQAESIARALVAKRGAGLFLPRLQASCVYERLVPVQRPSGSR
ncbi:hypothetical protein [Nannocystis punicea]|uniref:Uncharacterized protein n=1 Tax=Nannocystis punicea TaxID=2995304 RepID=A0ABY7GWQ7_9BACT|nr:hypothetical protein [Nannocystis poenicansa]WAS91423.1 hypothetical protein O0S08_35000 [Nannocystis poenicansa]